MLRHGAQEEGPPVRSSVLRAPGRRLTRQRQAIWNVLLAEPERHLSAEEVAERVREELPSLNPSTVYRTLDLLVAQGLLLKTDLGAGRSFYEPTRDHQHHHVVCEACGAVAHLHDEVLGDLPARLERASGYRLGRREISLFGLCPACRQAEPIRPAR